MRKIFKNRKGFAMAELLAVSIVLLFIFSVLFSNYLPLVAEYENRLSYNDVTAQYAAHYIRKMYKEALKDKTDYDGTHTKGEQLEATIDEAIKQYGYYPHDVKDYISAICDNVSKKDKDECSKIINQYGIEEIIITNYKLRDDTDADTKYVKKEYAKNDGDLYNYIHYLPNYEKSIYTGKDEDSGEQLYRIILKTKDYGYATTPILSDYKTPGSCFDGISNNGKITITEYHYNGEECGKIVNIPTGNVKLKNEEQGVITAIGDKVFSDDAPNENENPNNVTMVNLTKKVEKIGDYAFKGSSLYEMPDLNNVTSIGKYAFANTQIEVVDLSGGRTIGDYAFANNKNLKTVNLPNANIFSTNKDDSGNPILAKGLFAKSGTTETSEGIPVEILSGMDDVGAEMFYLSKIKSIDLGTVKTIGDRAFSQYEDANKKGIDINKKDLTIPASVTNIGEDSFRGLGLKELNLEEVGSDLSLGQAAFKQNNIKFLRIPSRVSRMDSSAFESSGINTLEFETKKLSKISMKAFFNNSITGDLKIPEGVSEIGINAFANNQTQFQVNFPPTLTKINSYAFNNTNLGSITIPGNVETIYNSAFTSAGLTDVEIEDSNIPLTINMFAFSDNKEMTKFTIPARTKSIDSYIFAGIAEGQDATITNNSIKFNADSNFWCDKFTTDISSCECSSNGDNELKITYVLLGITSTRYVHNIGGATDAE